MNRLYEIDMRIMAWLQKTTHKVQRTVGIRPSSLALTAFYLSMACCIGHQWVWGKSPNRPWFLVVIEVLIPFGNAILLHMRRKSGDTEAPASTFAIRWDARQALIRVLNLVLAILFLGRDIANNDLWFPIFVAGIYLRECFDLPSSPSKLRQWLDNLSFFPVPEPV